MKDPLSWLRRELPRWTAEGLVTAEQAGRIEARYADRPSNERSIGIVLILFGIIGALLIGGGLILIVAHNWSNLPHGTRAFVSVVPLIASQGLAWFTLTRRRDSTAWREAVGAGWSLSIAFAIAMVAQTYHMPGSFDSFMLVWMLLTLPVVYLMRSTTVLLIYFAGIAGWAQTSEYYRRHSNEFWLLLALSLPFVFRLHRRGSMGGAATVSRWGLIIVLIYAVMALVDYHSGVPWMITNAFLAAGMFGIGVLFERDAPGAWQQPAIVAGTAMLAVIVYCLTWHWFWKAMDAGFSLRPDRDRPVLFILTLTAVTLIYAVSFARLVMLRFPVAVMWAAAPLVMAAGMLIGPMTGPDAIIWFCNAYVLAAGLVTVWSGVRFNSLIRVNLGMTVVGSLVVSRFFDMDFDILIRAVVFILLGLVFLGVNMKLARGRRVSP